MFPCSACCAALISLNVIDMCPIPAAHVRRHLHLYHVPFLMLNTVGCWYKAPPEVRRRHASGLEESKYDEPRRVDRTWGNGLSQGGTSQDQGRPRHERA